jgi:hypothetical protein
MIRVSIGTTLLYLCYMLFFNKDTFYLRNRILLILILLIPVIIPAIRIPVISQNTLIANTYESFDNLILPLNSTLKNIPEPVTQSFDFLKLLFVLYFSITFIFLLRHALSISLTLRIIKRGSVKDPGFPRVVIIDQKLSPFSFFPYIVIPHDLVNSDNYNDVLNHEIAHVRQGHTLDLLLCEILTALQWFNPFIWFIRRSIIMNHEYLADQVSIGRPTDIKEYQLRLIRLSVGLDSVPIAHNFNSVVKNRIIMINKKPSSRLSIMKNLVILPVLAFVTYTSATPEYNHVSSPSVSAIIDQEHNNQAKGIVLGEDGKPLMLVTIIMRSDTPENIGVQTGSDGKFVINNLVKNSTL